MPAPVVDPGPHNIGFIILAMAVELRKQQIHTTRKGGTLYKYVVAVRILNQKCSIKTSSLQ